MKLKIVFLLLLCTLVIYPQVGIGTQNPHNSSILELESTTKGFLPPRMTEVQMLAIPNPATGLIVYCTDCTTCGTTTGGELKIFNSISWNCISENYGTGSSVFTADCNSASLSSSIYAGETSTSVLTISVTVTKLGTYYIESNIVNGLYFKGSGEFTTLGLQTVTLQSFGTAIQSGIFTWNYKAGSTSCSVTETILNSKSGRIVKILTIGDYVFSTTYMNNLFNNNPNEFGPSGVVKCNSFEFTRIPNASRNTINVTNLVSTFSQYDIIIMTSSFGLATNVWDNSTEDALVNYMKTKKSVVILEGDDLNITSDFYTILQKIGITSTNTFGSISNTEVIFDSASINPIKGTFGNISNKGVNLINGQAWTFNTTRTDLVFGRVRGALTSPNTVAFWDATHNLYYNGDDDSLNNLNNTACNIASPKSTTTCLQGSTEMRGARWLANLAAYTIETTPQKASIYE